jgi:hypothetical protein
MTQHSVGLSLDDMVPLSRSNNKEALRAEALRACGVPCGVPTPNVKRLPIFEVTSLQRHVAARRRIASLGRDLELVAHGMKAARLSGEAH